MIGTRHGVHKELAGESRMDDGRTVRVVVFLPDPTKSMNTSTRHGEHGSTRCAPSCTVSANEVHADE
jgi:hypothetical protein